MSEKSDKLRAMLEKEKERRIKLNNRIEILERRTQFLNLHLHRPPSQKLHPRRTAQPGSG